MSLLPVLPALSGAMRLAECQACTLTGQYPQVLCKACHRQKTCKCYHNRGHRADPLTDLAQQDRHGQAGVGAYRKLYGFRGRPPVPRPPQPCPLASHLDKLLPRPSRVKEVAHHPAMPYADVPAFFDELSRNGSVSALARQFLILTATRTLEVLHAEWREIDLPAGEWTVPHSRMKTRREHRVPLSESAMTVLEAVPPIEG